MNKDKWTIKQVKAKLNEITEVSDPFIESIQLDSRIGVQKALKSWKNKQEKQQQLIKRYQKMSCYEERYRGQGYQNIAGIDEVGRGPLAGPVVSAAVILPEGKNFIGLNDSKQLSKDKREYFYELILEQAVAVGFGQVDKDIIDEINIYQASKLAMNKAIANLSVQPDYLLIDAMELNSPIAQKKLIKGDSRSISIAAASIIAKVTRDRMMEEYNQLYPGYGFDTNAGYGTAEHLKALEKIGVTPIHRHSFAPVKQYL